MTDALKWMLLCREYDRRAIQLQRQGRWGVHSPSIGQEATIIGAAMALDVKRDWIVPQYREGMALVHHGYPLAALCAGQMGKSASARIPDEVLCLPNQTALAAQLPHAVGLAWGLKVQRKDGVVLTFFGEGASSEGDFHEALNLAGVQLAPVVFLLQNNQWAISTPRARQSHAPSLASRAAGYGLPGTLVDGNDVLAVFQVVQEATHRARQGGGPTLVEALTYRISFHNTSDNPSQYRDEEEAKAAFRLDPIERLKTFLKTQGCLDLNRVTELEQSAAEEVDIALRTAEAMPPTSRFASLDNAYGDLPERVANQRKILELGGKDA